MPGVEPVPEEALAPDRALALARELLLQGRPFGAHEVLEAVWKAAPDADRDFWQGLAQLCVGITHAERGNAIGAARLVERAARRLAAGEDIATRHGVDLDAVIDWARAGLTDSGTRSLPRGWPDPDRDRGPRGRP